MPIAGTEDTLSTLIKSEMTNNGVDIQDDAELSKLTDSIAKAVIDHIVANALVTVTVVGGSSAGVHTGTVG